MKNKFLLIICVAFTLLIGAGAQNKTNDSPKTSLETGFNQISSSEIFQKAIVLWDFSELNDKAGLNSQIKANGNISLSDSLQSWEYNASKDHGGDGHVAFLKGGHFSAGQGAGGELNLFGPFSFYIRVRNKGEQKESAIFSKGDGNDLQYKLSIEKIADELYYCFDLGLKNQKKIAHVQTALKSLRPTVWHDIVINYDGTQLRIYANGEKKDETKVNGDLKESNLSSFLVGGNDSNTNCYNGMIDHLVIWNASLKKEEILYLVRRTPEEELGMADESVRDAIDKVSSDPYRPIFHVAPEARFINDPNGPVYFNGKYHLFFQHLPYFQSGDNTGPGWGHVVSEDLVHWENRPIALMPIPGTYDASAIASGSCVINNGIPTIIYTSVPPQAQSMAMSYDGMETWIRYEKNPVISRPDINELEDGFRDPFVWKENDIWYMIIGAGFQNQGGTVLLYRSSDFFNWEYLNPLCTGMGEYCFQWECPSFFDFGEKRVLIISPLFKNLPGLRGDVKYSVGIYKDYKFNSGPWKSMDFGGYSKFYAPNGMIDPKGRKILWGWLPLGSDTPWNGIISIPRLLTLSPDDRLKMEPIPEMKALRKEHWHFENVKIGNDMQKELDNVKGNCLEIVAEIDVQNAQKIGIDVLCSMDYKEKTRIYYDRIQKRLHLGDDSGYFEVENDEKLLRLHMFIDKSVIELFINKRECITTFVRPQLSSLGIRLFSSGGPANFKSIDIWEIGTIWEH